MLRITITPAENGTAKVTATFTDEANNPVTPINIRWSLSDNQGTIINSRHNVSVTPASTTTWLLSGADLAIANVNKRDRLLTILAHYNSTLGSNLPLNVQVSFTIEKFAVSS